MATLQKKKKKTADVNVIIADVRREQDLEANVTALQPTFEGTTYIPFIRTMIDFVNVTETTDAAQTPA